MTSHYLSPEASVTRFTALYRRLAEEAVDLGPGGITWLPESDYWRLPEKVQAGVRAWMITYNLKGKQTCDFHS